MTPSSTHPSFRFILFLLLALALSPAGLIADDGEKPPKFAIQGWMTKRWVREQPGGPSRQQISIHWLGNRQDVASYEVEMQVHVNDDDHSNFAIVYLAPGGTQGEYTETDVTPGAEYIFRIRADFNDGSASDYK